MPTIRLTDQLGADVDVQLADGADLLRYLSPLPTLIANGADLTQADGLTLGEPAVRSLAAGLAFQSPVAIGNGATELAVKAGASAKFAVHSRKPGAEALFNSMGETIEIPDGTCYAATGIVAEAGANAGVGAGAFQFGAAPGASLEITNYRPWPEDATLLEALTGGLQTFVFPTSLAALDGVTSRGVLTVATRGTLRLSASAEMLAAVNPLSSIAIPSGLPVPALKAGGSLQVGAAFTITGEYQIRAHRLPNAHFHLGWYRRGEAEFEVSATASAGATLGSPDLLATLLRLVSGNPKVDQAELAQAGLSDGQIHSLSEAVKKSVSRTLELSVAAQLNQLHAGEAAFLYDIDPAALTPDARAAIDQALRCDLGLLHGRQLPGVTCLKTIVSREKATAVRLPVNVIGLAGASLSEKLAHGASILVEPATGAMVLADEIAAKRLKLAHVNFGADAQKLRQVLSESFLTSVAYRGVEHAIGGPELECAHSWYRLDHETSRGEMAQALRAGQALGLLSAAEGHLPEGIAKFDRTQVHIEVRYQGETALRLFLDATGKSRPRSYYESAGRRAIAQLVGEQDTDRARRLPANNDAVWQQIKALGPTADLSPALPGVPEPIERAIAADYATIAWWADAMADASELLAEINQLTMAAVAHNNPSFLRLRDRLAARLKTAAAHTKEAFGQPWGLVAMFEAGERTATASLVIAGPKLARKAQRPA